ncbi:MAG TPA: glycosyltransferase [Bryobacteraceae bacterium]|nr:glycosyltransferase [Bryobacteraceae bacterium]
MVALTIAGAVSALIWLYLLLGRGRFWRISHLRPPAAPPELTRRVAVVVPARNEAATIAQTIASLLRVVGDCLHIYLVDDGSADGTSQIAHQTAVSLGKLESLTILQGSPLPPGWSGKLWAVEQGIAAARSFSPEFILLSDADIVHSPATIALLVAIAETGGYDLVSFMVKLHCRGIAEKLLIPAFVFFFFMLYPPAWTADVRRATAGAAGGCLLLRPRALDRIGGIEAIRSEIIDDCALARAVKRDGGNVWLGLTESSASIRPYGSFAEIGRMISRTAFNQLRHSALLLLGAVAGLAITYLLPPGLPFSGYAAPVVLGAAAWALMTIAYLPMVRFYRLNPLWALTLPLAAVFYMGATVHSAAKYWLGRGGEWKGRAQDRGQAVHSP